MQALSSKGRAKGILRPCWTLKIHLLIGCNTAYVLSYRFRMG